MRTPHSRGRCGSFPCAPEHCAVQIGAHGEPAQALLQCYHDRLVALQALPVSAEVRFEFMLDVQP